MAEDRMERIRAGYQAAGEARRAREEAAAAKAAGAEERAKEAERLWHEGRGQLENVVAEVNDSLAETGFQLHTGDPYFSNPPDSRLQTLYVALDEITYSHRSINVMQIFVERSGEVHVRVGSATQLPVKEVTVSVEDITEGFWREWLLTYLEVNLPGQ